MSNPIVRFGHVLGTGAKIDVPLGFIPDEVVLTNITDGDVIHVWSRSRVAAFSSGGTHVLSAGDRVRGATSGVITTIREVFVASGTFAAGNAAGFVTFYEEDETGTFGAENINLIDSELDNGIITANVATIAAQAETGNIVIDVDVSTQVPANGVLPYLGVRAETPKGFSISAAASEAGKLFAWKATRAGGQLQ